MLRRPRWPRTCLAPLVVPHVVQRGSHRPPGGRHQHRGSGSSHHGRGDRVRQHIRPWNPAVPCRANPLPRMSCGAGRRGAGSNGRAPDRLGADSEGRAAKVSAAVPSPSPAPCSGVGATVPRCAVPHTLRAALAASWCRERQPAPVFASHVHTAAPRSGYARPRRRSAAGTHALSSIFIFAAGAAV